MSVVKSLTTLTEQIAMLPEAPGVYLFKNKEQEIIYIGKALSLRSRVRSYWNQNAWQTRPKLAVLVPKIQSLETIITNSEKEALLLEATLIRKNMPRYNVTLKDDKKYPWLCITYDEKFPRLIMVREPFKYKKEHPKARLFGPYVESGLMWETVKVLRKVFPMRQRPKPLFKDRPCMNYYIGLCLGPCQKLVEEDFYNAMVKQVELFLCGSQNEVIRQFELDLKAASSALRFEEAAKIRDRLFALKSVLEKQQVLFLNPSVSLDVIAEAHTDSFITICLMRVREGKLISSETFNLSLLDKTSFDEAFESFIEQYYSECENISVPHEVLIQQKINDLEILTALLTEKACRQVKIQIPVRGAKLKMIDMAKRNASLALERHLQEKIPPVEALELSTQLKKELNLSCLPKRIECFDISNIQGCDNVASMVVFENAQPKKLDYRTFKIGSQEGTPNDFASMKEVISRRFKRLQKEDTPYPDLVIIDGGKGQLNAALKALVELNVETPNIIALAKKQEEIYKPKQKNPILLSRTSKVLHLLQQIRDEAHRFAITFHRKQRAKRSLVSGFDKLPKIGPARRKKLIMHFGNFESLKTASLDEIKSVPGISAKLAEELYVFCNQGE